MHTTESTSVYYLLFILEYEFHLITLTITTDQQAHRRREST